MEKPLIRFSHSRRRFMVASTATASLALAAPVSGLAGLPGYLTDEQDGSAIQAWWSTLVTDDAAHPWLRPGWWVTERVTPDQSLRIRLRAPEGLSGSDQTARLAVDLIYRALPDQPFSLWRGVQVGQAVDQEIHAVARALKALRFSAGNRMLDLPLTSWHRPVLSPGRYFLVVDPTGTARSPDWSRLCWEPGAARFSGPDCDPGLISLMLDVSRA